MGGGGWVVVQVMVLDTTVNIVFYFLLLAKHKGLLFAKA